jgi:hypothetical protein
VGHISTWETQYNKQREQDFLQHLNIRTGRVTIHPWPRSRTWVCAARPIQFTNTKWLL